VTKDGVPVGVVLAVRAERSGEVFIVADAKDFVPGLPQFRVRANQVIFTRRQVQIQMTAADLKRALGR
jgi:hypothetical protein